MNPPRQSVLIFCEERNSVVANERVGEHEDLVAVRGVGEGLRVAHHAGLEDCKYRQAVINNWN